MPKICRKCKKEINLEGEMLGCLAMQVDYSCIICEHCNEHQPLVIGDFNG